MKYSGKTSPFTPRCLKLLSKKPSKYTSKDVAAACYLFVFLCEMWKKRFLNEFVSLLWIINGFYAVSSEF